MPTRSVELTDQQAALIDRMVETGRYRDSGDVLREGLRLVERRDAEDAVRLAALRQAASLGTADLDEGRYHSFETADGLKNHLDALAAEALAVEGRSGRLR